MESSRINCEALEETPKTAKQNHDVIVTIGGASVGDHDLVKPALEAAGAKLDFWRIAMKPGKPLLAAQLDNRVVIGLPGNPVSAFVTATLFLLPFVRYLSGLKDYIHQTQTAKLDDDLPTGRTAHRIRESDHERRHNLYTFGTRQRYAFGSQQRQQPAHQRKRFTRGRGKNKSRLYCELKQNIHLTNPYLFRTCSLYVPHIVHTTCSHQRNQN